MHPIMIAEADPFYAKFYRIKLQDLGYEVEFVTDGQQLFERLHQQPYALIMMNVMLPKKNGFLILEELQSTRNAETPVMVITELAQEKDQKEIESFDISAYFIKNITQIDEILDAVNELVGKPEEVRKRRSQEATPEPTGQKKHMKRGKS